MKIGGIVEQHHLALYTITALPDKPGAAGNVLKVFAREQINLEYITESLESDGTAVIAFCVDLDNTIRADDVIKNELEKSLSSIRKTEFVGIIGIYGPHFREKPAIAAMFCSVLGTAEVNILGISSSISTISCIIDIRDFEKAKGALLSQFELP